MRSPVESSCTYRKQDQNLENPKDILPGENYNVYMYLTVLF